MKKSSDTILQDLNHRLKHTPRAPGVRLPDDGQSLAPGQLWSLAGGCGDTPLWDDTPAPTWLVFLLNPIGEDLFTAVPVFRWGELAGPNDLYVPERLAGATLIAALELEATVDRAMLGECGGRLPAEAVAFVLKALAIQDDPVERNAFSWGLGYLGRHDHRLAYHQAINDRLEELQVSVRTTLFGEAAPPLVFPTDLPWSVFHSQPGEFPVSAAADSGEEFSPCLVVPWGGVPEPILDSASAEKLQARCLSFDPIGPDDADREICCEWWVETTAKNPLGALVYADGVDQPIGRATVLERDGGLLVMLTRAELPSGATPIAGARNLKIVILVKP